MMKFFKKIIPPLAWRKPVIILAGAFFGLGFYVFYISNAASYLSDEPETCINCHVMNPQYATWFHSSHRERASCNDCHVPHNNVVEKYYFKAQDGLRHASIFTMRSEPQVIQIKEAGKAVVQENCLRCHNELITDDLMLTKTNELHQFRSDRQCWDCHREVPHGRVNSLASMPNAHIPATRVAIPKWIKKITK